MTTRDINAGLRCIVYDAAVLAMALRKLRKPTNPENDLGRKTDQLAVEAALIKYRSIMDFLTGTGTYPEDIKMSDFGEAPVTIAAANRRRFRTSVNKYAAHLTWQRTLKDSAVAEFPRPSAILQYGPQLLQDVRQFIDTQIAKGRKLNRYGKRYYAKLQECMKQECSTIASGVRASRRVP